MHGTMNIKYSAMYKRSRRTILSHPVTVWRYKIDKIFKISVFLGVLNEFLKQCAKKKQKTELQPYQCFPKFIAPVMILRYIIGSEIFTNGLFRCR